MVAPRSTDLWMWIASVLREGATVRLGQRRRAGSVTARSAAIARLLPGPDPVEMVFAKLSLLFRKAGERIRAECKTSFQPAGYASI